MRVIVIEAVKNHRRPCLKKDTRTGGLQTVQHSLDPLVTMCFLECRGQTPTLNNVTDREGKGPWWIVARKQSVRALFERSSDGVEGLPSYQDFEAGYPRIRSKIHPPGCEKIDKARSTLPGV